jgi:hypothetical protein
MTTEVEEVDTIMVIEEEVEEEAEGMIGVENRAEVVQARELRGAGVETGRRDMGGEVRCCRHGVFCWCWFKMTFDVVMLLLKQTYNSITGLLFFLGH